MNDELAPIQKVLGCLEVLGCLDNHSERHNELRARCPVHNGKSFDSLSVKEGDDGRALLRCHAGCELKDIVEALGLSVVDLFSHNGTTGGSIGTAKKANTIEKSNATEKTDGEEKVLTTDDLPDGTYYEFTSPSGEVLYAQRHKGAYYRKVGEDLWKKGLDGVAQVLYNLHELVDGVRTGKTIYHPEGCKDVETAREKLGVVATTSGGTTTWRSPYKQHYVGADVVIVPDNDPPGIKYSLEVANDLATVAKRVRIVNLPGLGKGEDLTDWLDAGHTVEEFFAAVEEAPVYEQDQEEPWPDPQNLDTDLPPVATFTAEMLPEPLGKHVMDVARRMDNVAPDFIAAPLIVGAGSLIGRQICIRPKALDDWEVIPNLWGANVGPPSSLKTPAQSAALAPIARLGEEAHKRFSQNAGQHAADRQVDKARTDHLKESLRKAVKEDNPAEIARIRDELAAITEREEPTEERYSTSDATVEKLGELLRDNSRGLLNDRDELMGWLAALDRGGHEGDRAFFLESWDGRKAYHVDRIGRGSIHVPALCLSIFGGIQPGPLMTYVQDALSYSEKADGLLQRFQVLVWPDTREYRRSDEAPVPALQDAVFRIFKALSHFDAKAFGAKVDRLLNATDEGGADSTAVPYVRFTSDAQALYEQWRDEFEPRVRSGRYPAALESHLIKYRSLFPALALIFELLEYVSKTELSEEKPEPAGAIGMLAAARAAAWCEYLESHAMRLYHPAIVAPVLAAQNLLDHIEAGDIKHETKVRDIQRKGWQGLTTSDGVAQAVSILETHGWVRRVTFKPEGGGRPSEVLHLHPSLRGTQ